MAQAVDDVLPIFNFSLDDLPGEVWRPVFEAEKYAVISQFGRVKRIGREVIASSGDLRYYRPRIFKSTVRTSYKMSDGKYTYTLLCQVTVGRYYFLFNPMRMVYYRYCNNFPIHNQDYIVSAINGDDLDIRPDNLRLLYIPNVKASMNRDRRSRNPDRNIRLYKKAIISNSIIHRIKLVSCYDRNGKHVYTYDNIYVAHLKSGHPVSALETALTQPFTLLGGYLWRSGKRMSVEVSLFHLKEASDKKHQNGLRITQFDLSGNPINYYYSLDDAVAENDVLEPELLDCLEGRIQFAGFFMWKVGFWEKPIPGI
jgi:hypothetical protein